MESRALTAAITEHCCYFLDEKSHYYVTKDVSHGDVQQLEHLALLQRHTLIQRANSIVFLTFWVKNPTTT